MCLVIDVNESVSVVGFFFCFKPFYFFSEPVIGFGKKLKKCSIDMAFELFLRSVYHLLQVLMVQFDCDILARLPNSIHVYCC